MSKKRIVKVKIDKYGHLSLLRANKLKEQFCPFTVVDTTIYSEPHVDRCGDWCPLFREPYEEEFYSGDVVIKIKLCKRVLNIDKDEFIDERE